MLSCGRAEISYGGFRLDKYPYVVDSIGVYSAASFQVERKTLLTAGAAVVDSRYEEKIIPISGRIVSMGKNKLQMERALDVLHRTMAQPIKELKVGFEDLRYYKDTRIEGTVTAEWEESRKEYIDWSVNVLAHDPFAYSVEDYSVINTEALSNLGSDVRKKSFEVDVGGSAQALPIITISFPGTVPSPYGTSMLWLVNSSVLPNQTIRITRAFSASDVIEIDCLNQKVKINTVITDFDGQFIFLEPGLGPNTLDLYTLSTSNPTLNVSVEWKNRFLS